LDLKRIRLDAGCDKTCIQPYQLTPKKSLNFDDELIRESNSLMTINENGQRKRISKHKVAIKQLIKLAMTGNTQALRMYLDHHQRAHERGDLVAGPQPNNSGKYDKVRKLDRRGANVDRRCCSGQNGTRKWRGTRIEYGMNQPLCSAAAASRPPPMLQE
jgi:hypothetical protein